MGPSCPSLPTNPARAGPHAGPDGQPLGAPEAKASGQVAVPSLDGAVLYAGTRGTVMVLRRSDLALLDVIKVRCAALRCAAHGDAAQ